MSDIPPSTKTPQFSPPFFRRPGLQPRRKTPNANGLQPLKTPFLAVTQAALPKQNVGAPFPSAVFGRKGSVSS